jgi:putative endonuclease
MKYVYILESLDSEHFYVGITRHNAGEVPHTSKYRHWRLKTYVAFSDESRPYHLRNISSLAPAARLRANAYDA